MVECALMLALSTLLSFLQFSGLWAQGGSVTVCSLLPVIAIGYRHGVKWGVLTGFVHGLLQLMLGMNALKGNSLGVFFAAVVLDYILAFAVVGLAGLFREKGRKGLAAGSILGCVLRFLCHFASGITVWSSYAPEPTMEAIFIYSLVYNASYMLPELGITLVAAIFLYPVIAGKHTGRPFNKKPA